MFFRMPGAAQLNVAAAPLRIRTVLALDRASRKTIDVA
jgi:hypothetical protein